MRRIAGPLAGAAILVLALGLVIRYLTFGVGNSSFSYREGRTPDEKGHHVSAPSLADALEKLGFMHAERAPWVTFHLRQVALSGSAVWLGPHALPADQRSAELQFAERARAAWDALPESDKRLVEAYSRGINAALATRRVRLAAGFVLLDVVPSPWEPWHSLAVERLVLWLQGDTGTAADSILQSHVGWFGGEWNVAWGGSQGAIMGRYLMGHTSTPFLYEFLLDWPGTSITALTVPGTLMMPMARRETSDNSVSWAYLLQPAAVPASGRLRPVAGWKRLHDGRRDTVIQVTLPDVSWPGFRDQTDTDAWLDLWRGEDVHDAWQLMRPDGLLWHRSGPDWRVLGAPATQHRLTDAVLIASKPRDQTPADALDRFSAVELPTSDYSGSAKAGLDSLLRALPDSSLLPVQTRQAMTYLANWNGRFDGGEIGATLYDAMAAFDSTTAASSVLDRLVRAVSLVENALGPDMSRWRWSDARPGRLLWPGWQPPSDSMRRPIRIFMEHYPPVDIHAAGHPTTMVWRHAFGVEATNAWEGLLRSDGSLTYRSRRVPYQKFLAQHDVINEIHELRRRN
ncbi:MAG: hypothetical protein COV99_04315 [Bacteroidetes bacterium CG12_big_fil_rev_8_21_14_0_65_60_17]|nr:MAG: hypothetical protein COV99_04315 [Bacteroidetes bacterium CG12_big_fil_rev_8_21_14_0_65_60_17]